MSETTFSCCKELYHRPNCKTYVQANIAFNLQDSQELKNVPSNQEISRQNVDKIKLNADPQIDHRPDYKSKNYKICKTDNHKKVFSRK